jgi:hypothetical protein
VMCVWNHGWAEGPVVLLCQGNALVRNYNRRRVAEILGAQKMPGHNDKLSNSGSFILILAVLLLSVLGIFIDPPMFALALGLVGFACGAMVGGYVSVKIMHQPWQSSSRWAIYGFVGMCLPFIFLLCLWQR